MKTAVEWLADLLRALVGGQQPQPVYVPIPVRPAPRGLAASSDPARRPAASTARDPRKAPRAPTAGHSKRN